MLSGLLLVASYSSSLTQSPRYLSTCRKADGTQGSCSRTPAMGATQQVVKVSACVRPAWWKGAGPAVPRTLRRAMCHQGRQHTRQHSRRTIPSLNRLWHRQVMTTKPKTTSLVQAQEILVIPCLQILHSRIQRQSAEGRTPQVLVTPNFLFYVIEVDTTEKKEEDEGSCRVLWLQKRREGSQARRHCHHL